MPRWVTPDDPGVGHGWAWVWCGVSLPSVCGARVVWVSGSNSVSGSVPEYVSGSFLGKSDSCGPSGIVYVRAGACVLRWVAGLYGVSRWHVLWVSFGSLCVSAGSGGWSLYSVWRGSCGAADYPGPSILVPPGQALLHGRFSHSELGHALLGPIFRRRELRLRVGCPFLLRGSCTAAVTKMWWGGFMHFSV